MKTKNVGRKRRALITGASGGIGLEFARVFAREGYDLVLVARTRDALKKVKEELEPQLEMIRVNLAALAHLTWLFVRGMIKRGSGGILNVASTAGFMPGPTMAVYFATKSAVISFSAALAEELTGTGVKVTVLCPGAMKTGFQARAKMTASRYAQGKKMDPSVVARFGYESLRRGKLIAIPGLGNRIQSLLPRFMPYRPLARMVRGAMGSVES